MSIFEKNIKALFDKNPILASKIFGSSNKKFEIFAHQNDNANLNFIDIKKKLPLYETIPLQEIETKLNELNDKYKNYPVLFFFGIGNGILLKLLLSNPNRKKIVVIEPDIEILYIVLNFIDFSEEILQNRLIILTNEQLQYPEAHNIISHPDVILFVRSYELIINTPYYEKLYKNEILRINQTFIRAIKQAIIGFGNDTIDNLIGIEHSIQNFPEMLKTPPIQNLKNKKNSDIAIIVATGPSLTKQLPLLKEIQDYVTIISVDASMPILEKWQIVPDFVTSLERVKETAKFFKSTSKEFQEKFITIHASLQHEEVLKNSYSPKILSMRPFLYNKYFNLPKYGYLGIGMSAANMAYELAFMLGFEKIVLIGQDLAYSEDGKSHANGHVYGEDEVKYKETDIFVTKYGGNGVIRTTKVWNMFRNFFEKDISILNQKGIITINATEGGARIEGAIEMPFKEVINKYLPKNKKTKIKLKYPTQKNIDKNLLKVYNKTLRMLKKGEKVQKKVEKLFLKVAKEFDTLVELNKNNQLDKINFNKLIKLSDEIDKIKSLIEDKSFFSMYGEAIASYLINKETALAQIQLKNPKTDIEKKAKLIDWIMNHKDWLFMLAGIINSQRIVINRTLPKLEKALKERKIL
ncbi:motility associated factor glycosyltransferase family protein [Caminibacter profundus]